jgi:hypothetical protein
LRAKGFFCNLDVLYGGLGSSNGNDIETKRNDASVIGAFSVAKQNKPTYLRTWKDQNEANTIINICFRIEEITKLVQNLLDRR